MVKTDLPYTYLALGKYWRFRRGRVDVKLPGQPGDVEFHRVYAEKMAMFDVKAATIDQKSLSWLIKRYKASAEFSQLADRTQDDYKLTLDLLDREMGEEAYRLITRPMIKAVRDDYIETTRKANKIKQMMSRLYSWAGEESLVPDGFNPAAGLKTIKRKGGVQEIVVWSDYEIDLFLKHASPAEVTPVLLALYTGQRLSDVCKMTWNLYQVDTIRVRQSKTTALLDIACHKTLRAHLDRLKRQPRVVVPLPEKDFICLREDGVPWIANAFGTRMSRAVRKTPGMPANRSMHGLRYAAGSTMEEAGCTVAQIESVLGHRTFKMALKYASQRLRSKAALAQVEAMNEA